MVKPENQKIYSHIENQTKSLIAETTPSIQEDDEYLKIKAMEEATKTLSKFLNNSLNSSDSWLITQIKQILALEEVTPKKHKFVFENNREAAKLNTKIIKKYKYDFIKACEKQKDSIVTPGSEFRAIPHLTNLFSHHEDWKELRSIITDGCDYSLSTTVDEDTRRKDLNAMIARGNHKSTKKPDCERILHKKFSEEVSRGWIVPVTIESLSKIKDISVIPLGIAHQFSINEQGQRVPKHRVTHDATFLTPSGNSVNNRTIEELLKPCIYGQSLRRILHSLLTIRKAYPNKRILMSKYDLDAAYRRIHVKPIHNLHCATVINNIAYIPLRLPFGVAAGPSIYSTMSEVIFDLTNDLLNDKTWNLQELHSPIQDKLPQPQYLDDSIKFAPAEDLSVYVPLRTSFCDGYIDDFLSVGLELNDEIQKSQQAPTIAVHTIFRPISTNEPIPRNEPISERKLSGEGIPHERKTMLGWLLCTRSSRIFLPEDKAKAWYNDVNKILNELTVSSRTLESLIGRFNHIGYIIPTARYFINRLRHLLYRCEKYGTQKIQRWESDDLKLWQHFLQRTSQQGISFNNICFTRHNQEILTDASEFGLGGFNTTTGKAWRFEIPIWMRKTMHINLLEFIACTIGIWLEILDSNNKSFLKIQALTDNSSAVGWLYKASFNPKSHHGHDIVARKLAKILIDSETTITSQHTPGRYNVVADSLSRDFHLPDNQLTLILKSLFPQQAKKNFYITSTLPQEITSWIFSLRHISTKPTGSQSDPERSKTGIFFAGSSSCKDVALKINSLQNSIRNPKQNCCVRSQKVLEEMNLARQIKQHLQEQQYQPPSATYVRPFGRIYGTTRL